MNFKDLNIAVEPVKGEFTFHGETISVRSWLPTDAKIEFIQFVVSHAMNPDHGTFSPVITSVFETIAYIKYFTDIKISDEDLANPGELADMIIHSDLLGTVQRTVESYDRHEWIDISLLLDETISNIERFNASFAGTMTAMSGNATELGDQLDSIMEKLKNKEGLEEIAAIKEFMDKTE